MHDRWFRLAVEYDLLTRGHGVLVSLLFLTESDTYRDDSDEYITKAERLRSRVAYESVLI